MFWFFLICRILARLLWKGVQKDERSDDEEEKEEEEEEEVGIEEKETMMNGIGNGQATKPNIMVNGTPLGSGEAQAPATSGVETTDRKATLRKR